MQRTAEKKLAAAKAKLFRQSPFFAILAVRLEMVEAPWCSTMATDMKHLFWSRKFVDDLSVAEICGVLCHEVLHCAWLHPLRLGYRDHKIWNIATDILINQTVRESGMMLPEGKHKGIEGPEYDKYKGWTAERVYDDIFDAAKKMAIAFPSDGGGEKGDGKEMWGGVIKPKNEDGSELSESQKAELTETIKQETMKAAEAAKSQGKLPGSMSGLISVTQAPRINWKEYITSWVRGHRPDDYTWERPNRRYLALQRIYMPRMKLVGAGIGVLSIDTSGSVSDKELRDYIREIVGVIEILHPEKLYMIQHDAIVQNVDVWEAGDDFSNLKVKGRGGTYIRPVFDRIKKIEDEVNWMICFTDMGIGDYPTVAEAPDFPVLWAATGPDNAPFGTYLDIRKYEI